MLDGEHGQDYGEATLYFDDYWSLGMRPGYGRRYVS